MSQIKTIGIFAPASALKEGEDVYVQQGISILERLGLRIICAPNIYDQEELFSNSGSWTAGSIERRIESMMMIWSEVDVLLALRGGYGCIQLLEHLDYQWIQSNPRPVLGYSDLTALFAGLTSQAYGKLGLQSFHTPMLCDLSKIDEESQQSFINLLQSIDIDAYKQGSWRTGSSSPVCGGNLSLLTSLLGTQYLPSFDRQILFIEDCKEPGYKTQRMIYQLELAGALDRIQELWVGTNLETEYDYDLLSELAQRLGFGLKTQVPYGHGTKNHSLALY